MAVFFKAQNCHGDKSQLTRPNSVSPRIEAIDKPVEGYFNVEQILLLTRLRRYSWLSPKLPERTDLVCRYARLSDISRLYLTLHQEQSLPMQEMMYLRSRELQLRSYSKNAGLTVLPTLLP